MANGLWGKGGVETLEGRKGAGIRNKQEEAGRALATNFYIWFIVAQVIFHLLNTLPDLPLFCTSCISQAFERIKKCWLLLSAEGIALPPVSLPLLLGFPGDPGPSQSRVTVCHCQEFTVLRSEECMRLSGLSVSRCKPWIDFSSRERLWVCNWPFYCASKVKPDCFQAHFWSGKIESAINLILGGPSVCYHVVTLCPMYPLRDLFISVFSIVTKISQMCAEATHYEWPNLDLSHQTKVVK